MVNQRDAEINIKMATESTQIARSSQEDGKSLRMIQILTMIFLPASLFSVSSINPSPSRHYWAHLTPTMSNYTIGGGGG